MPLLNKEQIKEIIPHRDPFLLSDEVLELEPSSCSCNQISSSG